MLQALADRLAEAFAELLHEKVRKEYWGYVKDETLTNEELIKENMWVFVLLRVILPVPIIQKNINCLNLLGGKENTGITLTESLAMYPASSVCGWYFSHPQSQYFGVGKIQPDQLEDYIQRKGMSKDEMTRWLRPVLE